MQEGWPLSTLVFTLCPIPVPGFWESSSVRGIGQDPSPEGDHPKERNLVASFLNSRTQSLCVTLSVAVRFHTFYWEVQFKPDVC